MKLKRQDEVRTEGLAGSNCASGDMEIGFNFNNRDVWGMLLLCASTERGEWKQLAQEWVQQCLKDKSVIDTSRNTTV